MRLISSCICVLALMGIVQGTFPNDLYYSHHPEELAKNNKKNQLQNKYAEPHRSNRGGYRDNYDHPRRYDNRVGYHDGGRSSYSHGNGRAGFRESPNHRFERRSDSDTESRGSSDKTTVYNSDGSINWSYKAQANDNYASNRRQYRRPYDDDYRYDRTRNLYSDDYEDDYYDDAYQEKSYYRNRYHENDRYENDRYEDERYGNDRYATEHYGNSRYGNDNYGNDRYENDRYENDRYENDRYEDDQNYGSDPRGQRDGRQDDGGYDDVDKTSQDHDNAQSSSASQKNPTARYSQHGGSGFGYGLRLAGAVPDDGYNRGLGTFYDLETHVGGCGKQHKNTEFVASVNSEQMGDSCGKELEIVGPSGKSIKAVVVDRCKTCQSGGLDLSPAAYEQLGDFSHGSVPIKWKFV